MQNSITRELVLPADPETVWQKSFGTPAALASWFPQEVRGEFEPGNVAEFAWGEHKTEVRIVTVDPPKTLAYQWHPGDVHTLDQFPEDELTTVTFSLEPHADGTKVTVVETGFEKIAADRQEWALGQNNAGWDEEFAKLPKTYEA